MTVDPTKIRVGDEVTVRAKFRDRDDDGIYLMRNFIPNDKILSHTPAPRPFVVGGKVRNKSGGYSSDPHLLAQHEDRLWIRFLSGFEELVDASGWEPCD